MNPRADSRADRNSRRVFIGPTEVAGYFGNLQRGLEELGVETTYLDLSGHPFDYRRPTLFGRWARATLGLAMRAAEAGGATRRLWRAAWLIAYLPQMPVRIGLLATAALRHDVFILSSHTWVHRSLDLPLLRFLRKRVILVFTGTDHRPPYLDGWLAAPSSAQGWGDLARATERVRRRVTMAERCVAEIVALPASAHLHTRPIIDFLRVGIPFALPAGHDAREAPTPFRGDGVRVLHSPSNPVAKGTDRVRAAIEKLRGMGYSIDYLEIVRRPHREVLAALHHCDFVVDEVFSDTPMAGFAAEAAAFAKPAVVTGYYAELIAEQLPSHAIPPTLFEPPDRLVSAIECLVRDEAFRRDLGERAQAFVMEHWTPAAVARRYLRIIDGTAPDEWRWDPARQRYLYGAGMTRESVAATVRGIVDAVGVQGLGLEHAPELAAGLVALGARMGDGGSADPGERLASVPRIEEG